MGEPLEDKDILCSLVPTHTREGYFDEGYFDLPEGLGHERQHFVADNDGVFSTEYIVLASLEKTKEVIDKGANVNCKAKEGRRDEFTPLHIAVTYILNDEKRHEVIKLLVESGADLEARIPFSRYTPLHLVATYLVPSKTRGFPPPRPVVEGAYETFYLLLLLGANPDARDVDGLTPLELAKKVHEPLLEEKKKPCKTCPRAVNN